MKLTRPVAIICSIGNVELEIRQCLLGIFSNVEVGDVNLATSKVELATWQSVRVPISESSSRMGLHFNQFTGSIPWEQLCNIMPLLSFLLLNSNKFNRPILTPISNCTQLQTLFLADNKLSCPLPHQLGKLKKFQNLFAGNKQLTDPLPKELDNLPISNQMDISHNNITGLIPSNYGRNVDPDLDISIVDFSNNMLTGI
ncbi:unnamed protein product [Sphagnum jensenii]|uniref:Uncharacterized protein n=1 Tax=Sphagnum jensenii TaxID=128206 RepID=A0ABP1B4K6_9BRYO